MPRKPKQSKRPKRLTRAVVPVNVVSVCVPLPRPRGRQGVTIAKLAVPNLMSVHGITLDANFPVTNRTFKGWRLHVSVDGAPLVDGVSLTQVADACWGAVRSGTAQIVILTPREKPVEVAVGVEWLGEKRPPARLPTKVKVTVHGRY